MVLKFHWISFVMLMLVFVHVLVVMWVFVPAHATGCVDIKCVRKKASSHVGAYTCHWLHGC